MSFAIIRVRNLHAEDLKSTTLHNERSYHDQKLNLPNIDPERTRFNISEFSNPDMDLVKDVEKKLEGIKTRKNSVVALEYVCSLSPEVMSKLDEKDVSINTVLDELSYFLRDKFSDENIISVSKHFDESNPHIHVVAVPLKEKEIRWKNKNGQGVRKEKRLAARDYTGGKELLRQMQTDFYEFVTDKNKWLGKKLSVLGIEMKRGIDARDKRARGEYYSKMTNHIIGKSLKELAKMGELVRSGEMTLSQYQEKENSVKEKIESITDNVERKKSKDLNQYKENQRWKDVGLGF